MKERGTSAQFLSDPDTSDELRSEFLRGAALMGLTLDPEAVTKRNRALQPQQLLVADALNVGNRFNGVLLPRRSSKTTTLIAWALGRCLSRDDYLAAYTVMTTGKKARDRFLKDIAPLLERLYPDKKARPFEIVYGSGQERVNFSNGSIFQILAPKGDDFRSDAYDVIVLDESGEAEPDMSADVLSAALPTMDTRPGAMLVVAGTAAEFRDGNILWDELQKGRAGTPRHTIVEFSAPQEMRLDDSTPWEEVEPVVIRTHPGVGTLTTLDAVHDNFDAFTPEQFSAEYLGIFGRPGGSGFLPTDLFAKGLDDGVMPEPPSHFRAAFAVHPLGTSASLVAAWRVDGVVQATVLEAKAGTSWLYRRSLEVSRRYGVPIVWDAGQSVNNAEGDRFNRAKPKPKVEPQAWNAVATGAATLLREFNTGNIHHWGNERLTHAVETAVKRGTKDSKRWAFGRGTDEHNDITSLEALALALHAYDNSKPRQPLRMITDD